MPTHLRIHHWLPMVQNTLGPGRRAVVWVQGCSLRCPGCMVPETWSPKGGESIDPIELASQVLQRQDIEGITISGGEPTEQAFAVAELLAAIRKAGKNTWLYTGHTLEDLEARTDPDLRRLLHLTDVLVDGRYLLDQAGCFRWRGSANQRLRSLNGTIPVEAESETSRVEITLNNQGGLLLVGIPPPDFLPRLQQALAKRGTHLVPHSSWKK